MYGYTWMIVLAVLGTIASMLWYAFVGYRAFKAVSQATRQFEGQLGQTETLLRQFASHQVGQPSGTMMPQMQVQVLRGLANLDTQYRQLRQLERDSYDLRVTELQGMAANAGFDWTPPR